MSSATSTRQCPNCRRSTLRTDRRDSAEVPLGTAVIGLVLIALAMAMVVVLVGVAV